MKRKLILGSVLSGVFLYLALRNIEWDEIWSMIWRTNLYWFGACILLTMAGHYARAYRWKFMMLPVKDIPTNSLFSATAIGLMANNLLPARLGEVVRAYVLGREEAVSRTSTFAAIVYERIVDVFVLLILLWATMFNISGPDWLRDGGVWLLVLNVLALAVILLSVRNQSACYAILARLTTRLPARWATRIQSSVSAFLGGLVSAGKPALVLPILLSSVLVWGFAIVGTWCCIVAVGMDVPFQAVITLAVIVSMGTMIPSAPAYLGTMQYACIVSLALYQVGKTEALAFSLMFHASQFLPTTLLGLFFVWKAEFRLRDLSREGSTAPDPEA
jgi:glycosyltransferase 2 family protein